MSNFRFKNLDKLTVAKDGRDKRTLSVNRPLSNSGKVMQRCPNPGCQPAVFQMGGVPQDSNIEETYRKSIRRMPGADGITCPYCGFDAEDQEFIPQEDKDHALKEIKHAMEQDVSNMLSDMAKSFNRRNSSSRNSMFSISMSHKSSRKPRPFAYREDLMRNISCHVCSRGYGVFALGLFCPDCGSPNISTHFDREVEIINKQIEISKLINEEDNQEVSYRLLANAHEDALTALETTLKAAYTYIVKNKFPEKIDTLEKIGNSFQNLEKAEKKFKSINIDLLSEFSEEEKEALFKAIQKRHVIGHNLGLADEKYTHTTNETQVGRNVLVLAHEIEQFTALCAKLIHTVEKKMDQYLKELGYDS